MNMESETFETLYQHLSSLVLQRRETERQEQSRRYHAGNPQFVVDYRRRKSRERVERITYLSNHNRNYINGFVNSIKSLKQLKEFLVDWSYLAFDAYEIAASMTEEDFMEFKTLQEA